MSGPWKWISRSGRSVGDLASPVPFAEQFMSRQSHWYGTALALQGRPLEGIVGCPTPNLPHLLHSALSLFPTRLWVG